MTDKVFIDTNIWFYAFVTGATNAEKEKTRVASRLITEKPSIVISTQVLNELSVNLLKKAHFSESEIRVLISAFYRRYFIAELTEGALLRASALRSRLKLGYWDSLMLACAVEFDCITFYTEDMQDGQAIGKNTTICNPFATILP